MTERLPWIEKYRPKRLEDIIDNQEKVDTLRNLIANDQLPHLLFYGPPGTGKTSLIMAVARELYGDAYRRYTMEINASSERGIDTIRMSVVQFITSKSDQVKLILLDEADALTTEAQGALKSVIEKYSKYCRFCLICNDVNKISPALQSRCVKMVFTSLSVDCIKEKVHDIVQKEGINITDDGIAALVSLERDFRQLLNVLQGMYFYYSTLKEPDCPITASDVYLYMGKPTEETVKTVISLLFERSFNEGYQSLIDMYKSNSINMLDMINCILQKILTMKLNISKKYALIRLLSQIDSNLRVGCNPEIQIPLLVAGFLNVRSLP
jgi:replication factor C subunit 3/5